MKIKKCIMLTVISIVATVLIAVADGSLALDFRLAPVTNDLRIVCRLHNTLNENIEIRDIMYGGNSFRVAMLDDPGRQFGGLSIPTAQGDPFHLISAGERYEWRLTMDDMENVLISDLRGRYLLLRWHARQVSTQYICLGYPQLDGTLSSPVVAPSDPTAKPILAFIFNENQTNELGFVFLNGSNETVNVEKPLTQASRIVATAPAIGYTNELFIVGQPSESIAIKAGKVGEWRIRWKTIHDLIPAADLAAIKAAGGDLNLVWKVANFQSEPLPISLVEPKEKKKEKGRN